MGKRIITQRRGRGTTTYTSNSHRYKGKISLRPLDNNEKNGKVEGVVKELVHCPGHSAPLALIYYNTGENIFLSAPLGMKLNSHVESGKDAEIEIGNVLQLKNIPEGTMVYNVESMPGDGGKFVRCAGSFARVVSNLKDEVVVMLPSKKERKFNGECRAVIGIVAGGGIKDKPFIKAGKRYHLMKARGKLYPQTSGVAMNAVDHPFGSGRGRHIGKSRVAPRFAPPGRNVGLIRARRTGRKK